MNAEEIGKYIAKMRKIRGLTQIELAKLISVSNKTISKWECGYGLPDVALIKPLADALGVTVNQLLVGEGIEKENFDESKVDEIVLNSLGYMQNRFKVKTKCIVLAATLIIIVIILGAYAFSSLNTIRVYRVNFFSSEFVMSDGIFTTSKMENVLQLTNLEYTGSVEVLNNDFYVRLYIKNDESNEEIVIFEGLHQPIYVYEKNGNDEYFTERAIELIENDNLYFDISYYTVDGEYVESTYQFDVSLQFANNKILDRKEGNEESLTVSPAVEDFIEQNVMEGYLLENGFSKTTKPMVRQSNVSDSKFGETYSKIDDNCTIYVSFNDQMVITINEAGTRRTLIAVSDLGRVQVMNASGEVIFNDSISEVQVTDYNDDELENILECFKETVDLLN